MIATAETAFQRIMRKTGRRPVSCKCEMCKQQCRVCPCLGTPEDMERLIHAGYADKLCLSEWWVGVLFGALDAPVQMVQPRQTDTGCVFLQGNGLCELHDKGLKPTEGRLSHHSIRADNFKFQKSISWNVAKEWLSEANAETVRRVFASLENNDR